MACYGWVSAGFPWSAGTQKWVVLGLITRRSRVQIPPPLLKKTQAMPGFSVCQGRATGRGTSLLKLGSGCLLPARVCCFGS